MGFDLDLSDLPPALRSIYQSAALGLVAVDWLATWLEMQRHLFRPDGKPGRNFDVCLAVQANLEGYRKSLADGLTPELKRQLHACRDAPLTLFDECRPSATEFASVFITLFSRRSSAFLTTLPRHDPARGLPWLDPEIEDLANDRKASRKRRLITTFATEMLGELRQVALDFAERQILTPAPPWSAEDYEKEQPQTQRMLKAMWRLNRASIRDVWDEIFQRPYPKVDEEVNGCVKSEAKRANAFLKKEGGYSSFSKGDGVLTLQGLNRGQRVAG